MGWYMWIGILVFVLVSQIWPLIEPRLRPAHVADLKAGCKCIRCSKPISEGDTSIMAYGCRFGLAHLQCEKDALTCAGYGWYFGTAVIFLVLLVLVLATVGLPDIRQGKIRWTDVGPGCVALALIVAVVRERFDMARWRRGINQFVAEHPQCKSEQDDQ